MSSAREKLIAILKTQHGHTQEAAEVRADELIGELLADADLNEESEVKKRIRKKAGL